MRALQEIKQEFADTCSLLGQKYDELKSKIPKDIEALHAKVTALRDEYDKAFAAEPKPEPEPPK